MNNRIKEIRKFKDLSQEKFGEHLGVTKTAISKMELGTYNITDTMVKLICSEFNVSEHWLRTGEGEMFLEASQDLLELLGERINILPADTKNAISRFISYPPEAQQSIIDEIRKLFK